MDLTAGDFRKALEGLPDDAPVELSVSNPPDFTEFYFAGVHNDGASLVIRISADTGSDEGYVYRYLNTEGEPLRRCPECGGSFSEAAGLTVEFTDGTNYWSRKSRLDRDGRLDDPARDVLYGFHSGTKCGHCSRALLDMEGVEEIEEGFEGPD